MEIPSGESNGDVHGGSVPAGAPRRPFSLWKGSLHSKSRPFALAALWLVICLAW